MTPYHETNLQTPILMTLTEFLRSEGITFRELAHCLGVPPPAVSRMMTGKLDLRATTLSALYNYPRRMLVVKEDIRKFRQGLDFLHCYRMPDGLTVDTSKHDEDERLDILGFYIQEGTGLPMCRCADGCDYKVSKAMLPYAFEWARQARGVR